MPILVNLFESLFESFLLDRKDHALIVVACCDQSDLPFRSHPLDNVINWRHMSFKGVNYLAIARFYHVEVAEGRRSPKHVFVES